MRFTPKTEEEVQQESLLPDGVYDFEVAQATDKLSQKGADMIEIKLRVFYEDSHRVITDYLLEAMLWKLKHFCEATGLSGEYASGALSSQMCVHRAGRVKLRIEKDKTGKYKDKNSVVDYIAEPSDEISKPQSDGFASSAYGELTDADVPAWLGK